MSALPTVVLDPPTISMTFGVNDSPLAGRDGTHVSCVRVTFTVFVAFSSLRKSFVGDFSNLISDLTLLSSLQLHYSFSINSYLM